MEVPADILELIKCDNCFDYLSYSPVYLKNNGITLCGRCYIAEEKEQESVNANRNLKFEAVARLLKFPCKYKNYGCNETVSFAENYLEKHHEEVCEFKNYQCPVVETCEWSGTRQNILAHCQSDHPSQVMTNPCHLMHDIKEFSAKTYILHCFEVLFLLYTKVCIASGKIYHSVKLLDSPDKISHFKYTLDIKRDELVISRPGKVAEQNFVGTDENFTIVTSISVLLELLNTFSGTIFTTRIQKIVEDTATVEEVTNALTEFDLKVKELCSSTSVWNVAAPEGRSCRNKERGCTFTFNNNDVKCQKHEEFFCPFRTWCWTCWTPVKDAWRAHYLAEHEHFTFEGDTFFDIRSTGKVGRTIYVKTRIGYVCCRYFLNKSAFELYIWSSSLRTKLDSYRCMLRLAPDTSSTDKYSDYTLKAVESETWDWYIKVNEEDLDHWDIKDFQMKLEIIKQSSSFAF